MYCSWLTQQHLEKIWSPGPLGEKRERYQLCYATPMGQKTLVEQQCEEIFIATQVMQNYWWLCLIVQNQMSTQINLFGRNETTLKWSNAWSSVSQFFFLSPTSAAIWGQFHESKLRVKFLLEQIFQNLNGMFHPFLSLGVNSAQLQSNFFLKTWE